MTGVEYLQSVTLCFLNHEAIYKMMFHKRAVLKLSAGLHKFNLRSVHTGIGSEKDSENQNNSTFNFHISQSHSTTNKKRVGTLVCV